MDQNELADWLFDYNLSKEIQYLKKVTDSPTITFRKEKDYITGFTLKIRNLNIKDAEVKAKNRATTLKNILTILSGMPIDVNLQGMKTIPKPGEPTHVYGTFMFALGGIDGGIRKLDLNDLTVQLIINSSYYEKLKYENASKGIFYLYNGNPIECIKELFKIIERDRSFRDYIKYKVIRDMFSHSQPYERETVDLFLNSFDHDIFEYKKFDPDNCWILMNLDSHKNSQVFYFMAKKFVDDVKKYLKLAY